MACFHENWGKSRNHTKYDQDLHQPDNRAFSLAVGNFNTMSINGNKSKHNVFNIIPEAMFSGCIFDPIKIVIKAEKSSFNNLRYSYFTGQILRDIK